MFNQKFKIANFEISKNSKPLIIAEIGINHEGNFNQCIRMILRAKNSGANLVKLQIVDPGENYQKTPIHTKFSKRQCYQMRRYLNYMRSAKNKINLFSTFDKKNLNFSIKLANLVIKFLQVKFMTIFL